MNGNIRILGLVFLTVWLVGCYKQTLPEKIEIPSQFKVVALDEAAPSNDEVDIIISTHLKKASYLLLSPRTADTPYTFTLSINGRLLKESLKGVKEVKSDDDAEHGRGIHYAFKKRLRLKPGRYEIGMETGNESFIKVKIELTGGRIYTLRFEPVYSPPEFFRMKTFKQKVVGYKVYLDGNEIEKE